MAQPMCRLRMAQHLCRQRQARLICRQRLARLRLQLQQVVQHRATRGRHCDVELHCRRRQNPPLPSRSILSHAALGSSPIAADVVVSNHGTDAVCDNFAGENADRYCDSSHCVAAQTAAMATPRADHCSSTVMPTMKPPKAGRATWLLHVAGGSVPWEAQPSL